MASTMFTTLLPMDGVNLNVKREMDGVRRGYCSERLSSPLWTREPTSEISLSLRLYRGRAVMDVFSIFFQLFIQISSLNGHQNRSKLSCDRTRYLRSSKTRSTGKR